MDLPGQQLGHVSLLTAPHPRREPPVHPSWGRQSQVSPVLILASSLYLGFHFLICIHTEGSLAVCSQEPSSVVCGHRLQLVFPAQHASPQRMEFTTGLVVAKPAELSRQHPGGARTSLCQAACVGQSHISLSLATWSPRGPTSDSRETPKIWEVSGRWCCSFARDRKTPSRSPARAGSAGSHLIRWSVHSPPQQGHRAGSGRPSRVG